MRNTTEYLRKNADESLQKAPAFLMRVPAMK
jgi:hypothetical protein